MATVFSVTNGAQEIMFTKDMIFGWASCIDGANQSDWTLLTDLDLPTLKALYRVSVSGTVIPEEVRTCLRDLIEKYNDVEKTTTTEDQATSQQKSLDYEKHMSEIKALSDRVCRLDDQVTLINQIVNEMTVEDGVRYSDLGYAKLIFEPHNVTVVDQTHKFDTQHNRDEKCESFEMAVNRILARWW